MKKNYCRLSRYMLILMVLTISCGSQQITGQAEEQPGQKTLESNQTPSIKPEGMSEMFKGTVVEVVDAGRPRCSQSMATQYINRYRFAYRRHITPTIQ